MVAQATEIATVLKDVVQKQGLYSTIQGKDYVKVEGWSTLGCMLGITPREISVVEHEDGSYEAVVELYSNRTGAVVGRGSALCGKDEKRWGSAERYARRSMAITRATGKAYRLGFSWIMTLAGYEPTPMEEMADEGKTKAAAPKKKEEILEIPFGTAAEEVYTGIDRQKHYLAAAAKKHGISHPATLQLMSKEVSGVLVNHLDAAVAEWLESHPEVKQ